MAKEKKSIQQPDKKVDRQKINKSWDTPSRPITPTPAGSVPPDTRTPHAPKPADTPAKPQPRDKK